MEKLIQAIYGGIVYGSIFGMMALGLTLIWGALRMLNLAHGSLYLVGTYIAWALVTMLKVPMVPALLIAALGTAVVGFGMQTLFLNRILGKPGWDVGSLIVGVGVGMALDQSILLIFGPRVKQMPPLIPGIFKIGRVVINYNFLVVVAVAVVSLVLLSIFLSKSRHGLAIQAVSQQPDAAQLMGIPTRTVFLIVMCISAALAGLAGALLSTVYQVQRESGANAMLMALVVTIFGGLGSVKGTIWAAYLIGLLQSFLMVYLGAGTALPGVFLFMMIMLVIRPSGLFGLGEAQRL
ncbi:MAG: branched-chain amino acid ABC transporter permease [Anaerolineae bacterium]